MSTQSEVAAMPLESLLVTELGQKMVAEIIAVDGLAGAVAHQLDMLDVPSTVRKVISDAAALKVADMLVRDGDASSLLADADSVTRRRSEATLAAVSIDLGTSIVSDSARIS